MAPRSGDIRPHRNLAEFLTALAPHTTLTRAGDQHQGPCPFCGGTKRFRVLELGGAVVAKCRECDFAWADLLKLLWPAEAPPRVPGPKLYFGGDNDQTWTCVNPQTDATARHTRRPYVQDGKVRKDFSWTNGARPKTLIYRARLTGDGPLVVCEGEKCADALAARGLDAIGVVTGAPTVPNVEALVDCRGRDVLLWPDDESVGRRLMIGVAALPLGATRVRTVDPTIIGVHDAADWQPSPGVEVGAALAEAAAQAPPEPDMLLAPGALGDVHVADPPGPSVRFVPFDQVQPLDVTWLWRKRLAAGEITVVHGGPGAGKSLFGAALAALVSRGYAMPGDDTEPEPGDVAWIGHAGEDHPATITRPRLEAAGAGLGRVLACEADGDASLAQAAMVAAKRDPAPKLAIIDSWAAWSDGSSDADPAAVRARYEAIQPLRDAGVAIALIVHNRKAEAENPQDLAAGNKQIMAAPRLALHLDESTHRIEQTKGNIAGKANPIAYSINVVPVPGVRDLQPVMTFGAETVFDDPSGPGRGDGSSEREVVAYIMKHDEPLTRNQIHAALNAKTTKQKTTMTATIDRLQRDGKLVRSDVMRVGRKRDGYALAPEHHATSCDHDAHDAHDATEHHAHRASLSVGDAMRMMPPSRTILGSPVLTPIASCSTPDPVPENPPLDSPAETPPTRPELVLLEAPRDRMSVEQIGDLAGPAPVTATGDEPPPSWWDTDIAKPWKRCNVCGDSAACVPDDSGTRYVCKQCSRLIVTAGHALRQHGRGAGVVNLRTES